MKYRADYSFSFLSKLPDVFEMPLRIELDNKKFEINEIDENRRSAKGFIEASIDPKKLSLSAEAKSLDGTTIPSEIIIPDDLDLNRFVVRIVHTLSFIADTPIRYSKQIPQEELIPETPEDHRCLESFVTKEIYREIKVTPTIRTFSASDLREGFLSKLLEKETGLALYAQALLQQEKTARFRELWKILEAAFGVQDEMLIRSLAEYKPAQQLDFSLEELRFLHTLRGRASHAASRVGMEELKRVDREIDKKLYRLKCLVEQVLLTKQTWGVKSQSTDRIARLSSYISADGAIVIFKRD